MFNARRYFVHAGCPWTQTLGISRFEHSIEAQQRTNALGLPGEGIDSINIVPNGYRVGNHVHRRDSILAIKAERRLPVVALAAPGERDFRAWPLGVLRMGTGDRAGSSMVKASMHARVFFVGRVVAAVSWY